MNVTIPIPVIIWAVAFVCWLICSSLSKSPALGPGGLSIPDMSGPFIWFLWSALWIIVSLVSTCVYLAWLK